MHALFVHGMGRSPISGWPLLWELRRAGLKTSTFGYCVAFEDFTRIKSRLAARVATLATHGDYLLIGHSLGGVLLRAVVNSLPPENQAAEALVFAGLAYAFRAIGADAEQERDIPSADPRLPRIAAVEQARCARYPGSIGSRSAVPSSNSRLRRVQITRRSKCARGESLVAALP